MRKALIVGINTYDNGNYLRACVDDARDMATALSNHKSRDSRKNFDCRTWLDAAEGGVDITRATLRGALRDLFDSDGEVLLYFSGHGFLDDTGGLLCTRDATPDDWGVPMIDVVNLALKSRAQKILLILDCCHAGQMGMQVSTGGSPLAVLRENMTVVAASRASQPAVEAGGHGLFTKALLDALEGGAADHMGFVTDSALYAYASRRFSAWSQRPVYKTNATDVFVVRECEPLIDRRLLLALPTYFPAADHRYRLSPQHEREDAQGRPTQPMDVEKVEIGDRFRSYRDAGLLKSSDPQLQLYWVAQRGGTVELTPRGREYWWLAVNKQL